ncbi:NB-ARC domain containing protein [Parasponia andersonii]|uniref:NB-ARC domain containing protein n=1 Tax=Parasponia andersonii TaxID=3476 RepID=A0A2P5CI40_PARAD|nr:NB-ARC domain containing protein [Parasponia andersonii]
MARVVWLSLQQNLRRSCPDDDADEEIIILEDSMEALKMQLTRMEDRLHIVSVVGMGGLCKTTLAKKVYNDVKQHFDCNAWVFVSQQYIASDILYEILLQIERETERERLKNLNEHALVDRLKHDLKEKKYLVVLDDIWEIRAWDSIKKAFPNKNQASKILFTTRNKEVALYADPLISPVELPFLPYYLKPWKIDENGTKLEDIAEQYLGELMDRCMIIQASQRNQLVGGLKIYRMHDLMRNSCVCKARDENFFQIIQHDLDINMTGVGDAS